MKSFYTTLAFGLGASAAALKRQAATCDCTFPIQVNGPQSGLLGSLADGQIRVGPSFTTPINFCFNEAAGTISDNLGRGCLVAGAPMQYQCDNVNVPAAAGITIDNSGVISHNGSSVWYECAVDDLSNFNIYTEDTGLATKCQKVQLTTGGNTTCGAPKVSTVSVVGPTMFSTVPASTVTLPGQVSTVTAPAQVSTVSAPAASCPAASTITLPAPAAQTVTLPAPAASTVTMTMQSGASIVTVTSTAVSTVTAPAVTVTAPAVTVTLPATTVYVTSSETETATQSVQTTVVLSTTATETKVVPTTAVSVAPTTVVVPTTVSSIAVPTTSSVVVAPTTSSASTKVITSTIASTISSTVSSTSSAPTTCATAPINGQFACPEQCPLDLSNTAYEYPHTLAINGVNGYFGEVSANSTTSFTFDIPASLAGKTCDTYFALPVKSQLVTSDYTLSGTGSVSFTSGGKQVASFSPAAGNKYLVASGPCAAGQAVSYEAKATPGEYLRWFQDYNACALGLFVVPQ